MRVRFECRSALPLAPLAWASSADEASMTGIWNDGCRRFRGGYAARLRLPRRSERHAADGCSVSGSVTLATAAIAVNSAFHENGVQYGDLKETVSRILKKMIRTAFVLEAYFDLQQADIIFVTTEDAQLRAGCPPGLLAGFAVNSGRLRWSGCGATAHSYRDQRRLRRADHSAGARSHGRSRGYERAVPAGSAAGSLLRGHAAAAGDEPETCFGSAGKRQ